MEFSVEAQFKGFLETPQIFAKDDFFEYPLYPITGSMLSLQAPEKIPEPASSVLGKRMEDLFAVYVRQFTSEDILLQNQQVIRNKETLGELDFLLKDRETDAISHVELIYKFYLYDPNTGTSEQDHLIGPNRRDSLNRKLRRLQNKQFPLLFHPATLDLLKSLKISVENAIQKMCFKALVFLPGEMENVLFSEINPRTVAGYWIRAHHFTSQEYGNGRFFSPKKNFWPVLPQENREWFSYKEILSHIQPLLANEYAPLIWMKTPRGEFVRFFIVWW